MFNNTPKTAIEFSYVNNSQNMVIDLGTPYVIPDQEYYQRKNCYLNFRTEDCAIMYKLNDLPVPTTDKCQMSIVATIGMEGPEGASYHLDVQDVNGNHGKLKVLSPVPRELIERYFENPAENGTIMLLGSLAIDGKAPLNVGVRMPIMTTTEIAIIFNETNKIEEKLNITDTESI